MMDSIDTALLLYVEVVMCREDRPSAGLRKSLEELQTHLGRLSLHLDSVVFREVWKGAATGLNRLLYNKLVTECRFSPQVAGSTVCLVNPLPRVCLLVLRQVSGHPNGIPISECVWRCPVGPLPFPPSPSARKKGREGGRGGGDSLLTFWLADEYCVPCLLIEELAGPAWAVG